MLRQRTTLTYLILLAVFEFTSCKKDAIQTESGDMNFNIEYHADNQPLIFDTIQYSNSAGNFFSVTQLEYYISDIVLIDMEGNEIHRNDIHYINPRKDSTIQFTIAGVAMQNYSSMLFKIGLNSNTNKTGFLPPTIDNQNMFWPDPMGGGYHFLKLEGHFMDTLGAIQGYAMHLGTNACLVSCRIDKQFSLKSKSQTMTLRMNINEWFKDPNTYDLNSGNYIMGNQGQMLKIAENGKDVFTLK